MKVYIKLKKDFLGESGGHLGRKPDDPGIKQFDKAINDYTRNIYELIKSR